MTIAMTSLPSFLRPCDDLGSYEDHHGLNHDTRYRWQMNPSNRHAPGPAPKRLDTLGWPIPAIDAPWVCYSSHRRFFFQRGRIGRVRRGGLWQPVLNNGQIEIYLSCPYADCRRLVNFGQAQGGWGVHVERDGYHTGTCIYCDCAKHYWAVFEDWEKLLQLPMRDIT